jgi:Putative Ig domain/Regulator of chromosome condensation (RCC1) repeat
VRYRADDPNRSPSPCMPGSTFLKLSTSRLNGKRGRRLAAGGVGLLLVTALALSPLTGERAASANPSPGAPKFVSVGGSHTCAIRDDGTLVCWGDDSAGQLDGVPSGTFQSVSAGGSHTCAIRTSDHLTCWGDDSDGVVSDAPTGYHHWWHWHHHHHLPEFLAVSVGDAHACAIRDDGTLACWGDDSAGQLDGVPSGTFQSVSAGGSHTCAIRDDGTLVCWGNDSAGQLDDVPDGQFQAATAGGTRTCAIGDGGGLVCWGSNGQGPTQPELIGDPPSGMVGVPYSFQFETTPQQPSPEFLVSSGHLPGGLTLSPSGLLSGTPTAAGSYTFTVTATDGAAPDAERKMTLVVQDAPPQPDTGLPPPIAGKTFNIEPVKGRVKVRCRHRRLHKLKAPEQVPISCVIDASDGTVGLTTSKGSGGGTQSGRFWGGVFGVHQRARHRNTVLTLIGKLGCERKKKRPEAGKVDSDGDHDGDRVFLRKRKRRGRKLWGSGKGSFKTVGNYGSASVRGTIWLVEDRCDSTLFKVRRGTVWVHDFVTHRLVVLHAGRHYVARAPHRHHR